MGDYTQHLRYLLIVVVLFTSCRPATRTNQSINFFSIVHIPVVEGRINGKVAFFIVDTGASCSILNESVAKHYGFKTMLVQDEHLMGLNGTARMKTAYDYSITLSVLKIKGVTFRTRKIDELVDVIKNNESIAIAGIIGSDVLKKYQMGIDFRTNKISFMQRIPGTIELQEAVTLNSNAGTGW
jgi:predicted aspartyl protease